tara:strand:+ start:5211 stop:6023 length:813 start_codon:yes stop_codon:yes gene_type:complete
MKAILLGIDPQNDFVEGGNLAVTGGAVAMDRLADMVNTHSHELSRINVTLDSHNTVHIAHPLWWKDGRGNHPDPYTIIDADMVRSGKYRATNPAFQSWSLNYVENLEKNKRYALCIWPFHCRIGTTGACVTPKLSDALYNWEMAFRKVNYVPKGSNIFVEHYSAVKADVEFNGFENFPADPTTQINYDLITALQTGQDILLAGLALDFCLANTVIDVAEEFSEDEIKKLVLLEDCTASVNAPSLEHLSKDFLDKMTAKGMRISTSTEYFK